MMKKSRWLALVHADLAVVEPSSVYIPITGKTTIRNRSRQLWAFRGQPEPLPAPSRSNIRKLWCQPRKWHFQNVNDTFQGIYETHVCNDHLVSLEVVFYPQILQSMSCKSFPDLCKPFYLFGWMGYWWCLSWIMKRQWHLGNYFMCFWMTFDPQYSLVNVFSLSYYNQCRNHCKDHGLDDFCVALEQGDDFSI